MTRKELPELAEEQWVRSYDGIGYGDAIERLERLRGARQWDMIRFEYDCRAEELKVVYDGWYGD